MSGRGCLSSPGQDSERQSGPASSSRTDRPCSTSRPATTAPDEPAPTTRTSAVCPAAGTGTPSPATAALSELRLQFRRHPVEWERPDEVGAAQKLLVDLA